MVAAWNERTPDLAALGALVGAKVKKCSLELLDPIQAAIALGTKLALNELRTVVREGALVIAALAQDAKRDATWRRWTRRRRA